MELLNFSDTDITDNTNSKIKGDMEIEGDGSLLPPRAASDKKISINKNRLCRRQGPV
jgi:hypothetical protein